jgi:hypothetical protein
MAQSIPSVFEKRTCELKELGHEIEFRYLEKSNNST